MKKPRIYIAGKITGLPIEEAKAKFKRAECFFIDNGYEVVNPMELPHDHDKSWESYMRECIAALVTCDSIALLENYRNSKGALLEFEIALRLDFKQFYFEQNGFFKIRKFF
jgi:Asp-tRNA(Asn)/Glu-tRNA(Gln) amidotransferase A subunit family amidase